MAPGRFVRCAAAVSPKMLKSAKTAKMKEETDVNLHMEFSVHRPIPTEVEGEPLSEAERMRAQLDYGGKRYFRLVVSLGEFQQAFQSPVFKIADKESVSFNLRLVHDYLETIISSKLPDLLNEWPTPKYHPLKNG